MTVTPTAPEAIPANRFEEGDFVGACKAEPASLVYFVLNVGDGDTQLILLPRDPDDPHDTRQGVVVDVATQDKLPGLIEALAKHGLLPARDRGDEFPVVIGTHPHDDHIAGMPQFIAQFGDHISEYWDSGYYHPTASYLETMVHLEQLKKRVLVTQPTSGMTRYLGTVRITALTPGVGLRSRFDTYGVNINDASIALKMEFPASRIVQRGENRSYVRPTSPWSLLLGADAQTTSWAQATVDFPQVHAQKHVREAIRDMIGPDPLQAHIFKVPHHASKHGVNVELVERVRPKVCLVSSVGGAGRYNFPHHLAVEAIREGIEPTTSGQNANAGLRPQHPLHVRPSGSTDERAVGDNCAGDTGAKGPRSNRVAILRQTGGRHGSLACTALHRALTRATERAANVMTPCEMLDGTGRAARMQDKGHG